MMKWLKQLNGFWMSQGKKGNFLIWQERENWHGRYLSMDGVKLVMLPKKLNLSEMICACENNIY